MKKPRRMLFVLRPPVKWQADQFVFCVIFLLGAALGYLAGALVPVSQIHELADYVLSYSRSSSARSSASAFGLLAAYFRVPTALFLLGFASCGAWLIPVIVSLHGFMLSFSIRCFSDALGRGGALLAMSTMGIRCLIELPCMFYLACRCWRESLRRRNKSPVRDKPERPAFYPLLICGVALLIGCILDAAVSPRLLSVILNQIT